MLFNSYIFIFGFLPITAACFFALGSKSPKLAASFLGFASLFFYGYWAPTYLFLLLASILFNFGIGLYLVRYACTTYGKNILGLAIAANLFTLAYYKYANFFVHNLNLVLNTGIELGDIILPLGISFFTFTQIAFLVDAYRGEVREYSFVHYLLFVTYFPHLIAGPVLHHREMMPQFGRSETYRLSYTNMAVGITVFSIGLFKKVVIADNIAKYVSPAFEAAAEKEILTFFDAWGCSLAYTMQLYFDFSGYSDMAIGLSRLFGVKLPLNFNSPYKAKNIIEFWRRWHITLSRFLRDYLYFSLGGNRKGPLRRYANLMVTMVLGGLWHGAGWPFVLWGTLHGLYLIINQAWLGFKSRFLVKEIVSRRLERTTGIAITFIAVVIAWVFFRAPDASTAMSILKSMAGFNGIPLPEKLVSLISPNWLPITIYTGGLGPYFQWPEEVFWLFLLLVAVWFMPATHEIMAHYEPALADSKIVETIESKYAWQPRTVWLIAIAAINCVSLAQLDRVSEFLYFQF